MTPSSPPPTRLSMSIRASPTLTLCSLSQCTSFRFPVRFLRISSTSQTTPSSSSQATYVRPPQPAPLTARNRFSSTPGPSPSYFFFPSQSANSRFKFIIIIIIVIIIQAQCQLYPVRRGQCSPSGPLLFIPPHMRSLWHPPYEYCYPWQGHPPLLPEYQDSPSRRSRKLEIPL